VELVLYQVGAWHGPVGRVWDASLDEQLSEALGAVGSDDRRCSSAAVAAMVDNKPAGAPGGYVPWGCVAGDGGVVLVRGPRSIVAGGRDVSGAQGRGGPEAGAGSRQKRAQGVVMQLSVLRHASALVAEVALHVVRSNMIVAQHAA